jgi:hypothetical protein
MSWAEALPSIVALWLFCTLLLVGYDDYRRAQHCKRWHDDGRKP